jgi:hypothetical protein
MMKKSNIAIIILSAAVVIMSFLYFNGQGINSDKDAVIEHLKFQKDSTQLYDKKQSEAREAAYRSSADSLLEYNKIYIKADSINKIIIRNEKAKLRLLTRAGRDHVRDSIFRANGVTVRP